jgi:ABC-type multidrug transport system fused ATPase/permease subunit
MDTDPKNGSEKADQNHNAEENMRFVLLTAFLALIGLLTVLFLWVYHVSFQQLDENSTNPPPLVFFVTATFSLLLFIGLIVQVFVNALQWRAAQKASEEMRNTLEQNERHFKISNRPVIAIKDIRWNAEVPRAGMVAGKFWRVYVDLQNFGNTPAFEVNTYDALLYVVPAKGQNEPCLAPKRRYYPYPKPTLLIAPGAPVSTFAETINLTEDNVKNIWSDDRSEWEQWERIMLWINIGYKDAYGDGYVLKYHAKFNRVGFEPCFEHCEAT